jgi:hypothetical protein
LQGGAGGGWNRCGVQRAGVPLGGFSVQCCIGTALLFDPPPAPSLKGRGDELMLRMFKLVFRPSFRGGDEGFEFGDFFWGEAPVLYELRDERDDAAVGDVLDE